MKPHLAAVVITAALAGCAVCAEPYGAAPYAMNEDEAAPVPPAPLPAVRLPSREEIDKAFEAPSRPERENKTQGM